jgi:hypothetical protein
VKGSAAAATPYCNSPTLTADTADLVGDSGDVRSREVDHDEVALGRRTFGVA